MEENQNTEQGQTNNTNENSNISSEEIKQEASQTINDVKDTIKNTNLKEDTKAAKGFFTNFFKTPIETIKNAAADSKNSFLKMAIIVLAIWLVAILFKDIVSMISTYLFGYLGSFEYFFKNLFSNLLSIIKGIIAPVIFIAVISGLVYGFKKNKNKSFLNIVSTITISQIPVVIAEIISILTLIGSGISRITSAFSGFCSILSTVLLYFAIKELSDEENENSYFWKFALIMGIFYIVKFVFSYLEIYI